MNKRFDGKGLNYIVRQAVQQDAKELSAVRVQIDGETEYLDRKRVKVLLMKRVLES